MSGKAGMTNAAPAPLAAFHDDAPETESFRDAVLAGLSADPKTLPCKFFYDARGSALFDRICEQPEYYQTRTEMGLMRRHGAAIGRCIGPGATVVEFGSGSSAKIRLLLKALERPAGYVAVDISREHLIEAAAGLAADHPRLPVAAVCTDFTQSFRVPLDAARRVGFFPGSTIGNFERGAAGRFLEAAARTLAGGGLLIGVDLKKDRAVLDAAYNDAAGVTADFNLNILRRINAELGGRFDLSAFAHKAFYNPDVGRIEMHLESLKRQAVPVAGQVLRFDAGETIHTESSHKYTPDEFEALAAAAGFVPAARWVDEDYPFALYWLETTG